MWSECIISRNFLPSLGPLQFTTTWTTWHVCVMLCYFEGSDLYLSRPFLSFFSLFTHIVSLSLWNTCLKSQRLFMFYKQESLKSWKLLKPEVTMCVHFSCSFFFSLFPSLCVRESVCVCLQYVVASKSEKCKKKKKSRQLKGVYWLPLAH